MVSDGEGKDFKVSMGRKEVVNALLPLQEHWLPLSNLDLLLPPVDVGIFFCYNKPIISDHELKFGSMVGLVKKALAQTLISFYAFSGEVVQNSFGEPEILCNNRGVDFYEAFADVELKDLNLYNPDQSVEAKLVPSKNYGVLSVQVTELKCGGLIVGCTFDHRIADAYSANMFLVSWAEMAQSKPFTFLPSYRRSILNPRRPKVIHPYLDDMYIPVTSLPPPKAPELDSDHLISRIYYVKAEQLDRLQSLASSNGLKRTKLESFSAFLWKLVAMSSIIEDKNKQCKMGIVVDGRRRLMEGECQEKAKTLSSYFGNVLSIPFGGKTIEEMLEKPLHWVAREVHEFLDGAATKEHFLSLIDWVEAHRPVPGLAKIYTTRNEVESTLAFVVSSGQQFPITKVDFGWGRPTFGSYHFLWGGDVGYVMPMPSPSRNSDWVVYMHLFKRQIELIEKEAPHVFRPFTLDFCS